VIDGSVEIRWSERGTLRAGVNNLTNLDYFTTRTTEYPGPGIIPSIGRSLYVTLQLGM
jgi:Fe(3+) dicitrate transport protein